MNQSIGSLRPSDLQSAVNGDTGSRESGASLNLPCQLGAFELIELLGGGGFAEVYRAVHAGTAKDYAIKVLRAGFSNDARTVERFQREARIAAKLKHPGIVRVSATGQASGRYFHVMPLVNGQDLLSLLQKRPTEPLTAVHWMIQIAEALAFVHKNAVLHRDIKPSNILIERESQRPMLMDFGLARSGDVSLLTQPMDVLGTEPYMPPEQADPKLGDFSVATDIYGLGATLYQMLTGRPPFPHRGRRQHDIRHQIAWDRPEPPSALNPDVHDDLERICLKCLRKMPFDRYESADALRADLELFRDGKPVTVRPITTLGQMRRFHQRRPALARTLVGLVGGFVLALTAAAFFADQSRQRGGEAVQLKANLETESGRAKLAVAEKRIAESQATTAQAETVRARHDEEQANRKQAETQRRKRIQQYLAEMREAPRLWASGATDKLSQLLDRQIRSDGEDLRGPEWHYWNRILRHACDVINGEPDLRAIAISPDSTLIAAATETHALVWQRSDHRERVRAAIANGARSKFVVRSTPVVGKSIAFSPDGEMVAACTRIQSGRGSIGALRVWRASDAKEVLSIQSDPRISGNTVAFSPDSRHIITGGYQNAIIVWEVESGREGVADGVSAYEMLSRSNPRTTDATDEDAVHDLRFEGDPSRLIVACPNMPPTLLRWPTLESDDTRSDRPTAYGSIVVAGAKQYLLTVKNDRLTALSPALVAPAATARDFKPEIDVRCMLVAGRVALTAGKDNIVRLWALGDALNATSLPTAEYKGATDSLRHLAFSADYVAAADEKGAIRIWPRKSHISRATHIDLTKSEADDSPRFGSPRGTYSGEWRDGPSRFAVQESDGTLITEIPGADGRAIAVEYSPDERFVAVSFSHMRQTSAGLSARCGSRPLITLWRIVPLGKVADFHPTQQSAGRHFDFSEDGTQFAVALGEAGTRVVRTDDATDVLHNRLAPSTVAEFSRSGRYLAISAVNSCGVWDLENNAWAFECDEPSDRFIFNEDESMVLATGRVAGASPFAGNLANGALIPTVFGNKAFQRVECSADGRRVYALESNFTLSVFSTQDDFGLSMLEAPIVGQPGREGPLEAAFLRHVGLMRP